jgi:hypothetical protein
MAQNQDENGSAEPGRRLQFLNWSCFIERAGRRQIYYKLF